MSTKILLIFFLLLSIFYISSAKYNFEESIDYPSITNIKTDGLEKSNENIDEIVSDINKNTKSLKSIISNNTEITIHGKKDIVLTGNFAYETPDKFKIKADFFGNTVSLRHLEYNLSIKINDKERVLNIPHIKQNMGLLLIPKERTVYIIGQKIILSFKIEDYTYILVLRKDTRSIISCYTYDLNHESLLGIDVIEYYSEAGFTIPKKMIISINNENILLTLTINDPKINMDVQDDYFEH